MIVLTIWVIADVIDATTGTDGTQVAQTSQSPQPEPSVSGHGSAAPEGFAGSAAASLLSSTACAGSRILRT